MATQTLWSEFLGRLLLGATLAGPVALPPPPQDPAARPAAPDKPVG